MNMKIFNSEKNTKQNTLVKSSSIIRVLYLKK